MDTSTALKPRFYEDTFRLIGDTVIPKPHHTAAAKSIFSMLKSDLRAERSTLTIAGESGSGKSEIAFELKRLLEEATIATYIFAQDDYFHRPPKTNEQTRIKNIKTVGIDEVNLRLLDEHLRAFKKQPAKTIQKPLVVYQDDAITKEKMDPADYHVAIAEGTYTTLLKHSDHRVFIDRTVDDTREHRIERAREADNEFYDNVLQVEHEIISRHRSLADIIVNKDYSVQLQEK